MRFTGERVGLDEVVVDAEEALDAVEGSDLLDGVLIPLGVRLFLRPVSSQVKEGEAAVEEVGHLASKRAAMASGGSALASGHAAVASGLLLAPRAAWAPWSSLDSGAAGRRPRLPRRSRWLLRCPTDCVHASNPGAVLCAAPQGVCDAESR